MPKGSYVFEFTGSIEESDTIHIHLEDQQVTHKMGVNQSGLDLFNRNSPDDQEM